MEEPSRPGRSRNVPHLTNNTQKTFPRARIDDGPRDRDRSASFIDKACFLRFLSGVAEIHRASNQLTGLVGLSFALLTFVHNKITMRAWLEYDLAAVAVLVFGLTAVELFIFYVL